MVTSTRTSEPALLSVYLNDHLAGAFAGVELARRLAKNHRGTPAAAELDRVAAEIAEDRATEFELMAALGIRPRRYKAWIAWLGEKIARLKPNRRIFSRSPLSTLVELEAMQLGVEGKAAGWRTLRVLADRDARIDAARLDNLLERAGRQIETLERIRLRSAAEILHT